jgi:hypothetical protein
MSWPPRDWSDAEFVTAAFLNTFRSNLSETETAKATATGDFPYGSGANAVAVLAAGTPQRGMRVNAGASALEYAAFIAALPIVYDVRLAATMYVYPEVMAAFTVTVEEGQKVLILGTILCTTTYSYTNEGYYVRRGETTIWAGHFDYAFRAAAGDTIKPYCIAFIDEDPPAGEVIYNILGYHIQVTATAVLATDADSSFMAMVF